MAIQFATDEWIKELQARLNGSEAYAGAAKTWEGDLLYVIERPGASPIRLYLDLWHGKCRDAGLVPEGQDKKAAFSLVAPMENFVKVLRGQLDPMQAMMTGKLKVQGNMVVMMRNIPAVLEFVRTAQGIDTQFPE